MSPSISGCYSSTFRILVSCFFLTFCLCSFNCLSCGNDTCGIFALCITNFMGHDLVIIVVRIFFIGLYRIDMNVIHLFIHQCCLHCFDMNVIYLFILFKHKCYMYIRVVYTQKLCTRLLCLNNVWHLCLNDMHPWNNIFCTNLERTHEVYIFVMCLSTRTNVGTVNGATLPLIILWALASKLIYFFLTFDHEIESTFLSCYSSCKHFLEICYNLISILQCSLHFLFSFLDLGMWFLWIILLANKHIF
jgi:hypothetical protein